MSSVSFVVFGTPMPKGSKTAVVRGTRAVLLDARRGPARKAYRAWELAVELAGREAMAHRRVKAGRSYEWISDRKPLDGALAITATFYLARPKYETKAQRQRTWHTVRPDVDKLLRGALDPLSEIVIADDARIAFAQLSKRYIPFNDAARPRASITITKLLEGE